MASKRNPLSFEELEPRNMPSSYSLGIEQNSAVLQPDPLPSGSSATAAALSSVFAEIGRIETAEQPAERITYASLIENANRSATALAAKIDHPTLGRTVSTEDKTAIGVDFAAPQFIKDVRLSIPEGASRITFLIRLVGGGIKTLSVPTSGIVSIGENITGFEVGRGSASWGLTVDSLEIPGKALPTPPEPSKISIAPTTVEFPPNIATKAVPSPETKETSHKLLALQNLELSSAAQGYEFLVPNVAEKERGVEPARKNVEWAQQNVQWQGQLTLLYAQKAYDKSLNDFSLAQNMLNGAKASLSTPRSQLPTSPVAHMAGVNANRAVLQSYAPKGTVVTYQISYSSRSGEIVVGEETTTDMDGSGLLTSVVRFSGTYSGAAAPNRIFNIQPMANGKPFGTPMQIEWNSDTRLVSLRAESFSGLAGRGNEKCATDAAASSITLGKDLANGKVRTLAPAPVDPNQLGVMNGNNTYAQQEMIWQELGIPLNVSALAWKEFQASDPARYGQPGSDVLLSARAYARTHNMSEDNMVREVLERTNALVTQRNKDYEKLIHATSDLVGYLLQVDAGYSSNMDLKRLETNIPFWPTRAQIEKAVSTNLPKITAKLGYFRGEEVAQLAAQENGSQRTGAVARYLESEKSYVLNTTKAILSSSGGIASKEDRVAAVLNNADYSSVSSMVIAIQAGTSGIRKDVADLILASTVGKNPSYIAQVPGNAPGVDSTLVLDSTGMGMGPLAMAGNAAGASVRPLLTSSSNGKLGKIETFNEPLLMRLRPGETTKLTFELTKTAYLNTWMENLPAGMTFALNKEGRGNVHSTERAKSTTNTHSGISMSAELDTGTYTLFITCGEKSFGINPTDNTDGTISLPLHLKLSPPSRSSIEGMISQEGNPNVFPVRMSVVAFNRQGERITKDPNTEREIVIDPNKPTWIVVHGREDSPESGKMTELSKVLYESGCQVIELNWEMAAKDNFPHIAGLQGEEWIEPAAEKFFQMLETIGLEGENIRIGAHSWGSFLGYELSERLKARNGFGIDTFIALDSAKDPTLSNRYDASQIDFSAISKRSYAFHSSFLGSSSRTHSAQFSLEIRSPNSGLSEMWDTTREHGLAVTAFANLIALQKTDPTNPLAKLFGFSSSALNGITKQTGIDAWIWVNSVLKTGKDPKDKFIDATPVKLTVTNPDDAIADYYYFNYLQSLDEEIRPIQ